MAARLNQLVRSAFSLLPTLGVLGVLAGLATVGYLTDWKPGRLSGLWKPASGAGEPSAEKPETDGKSADEGSDVRFASPEAVDKSGIETAVVKKRLMRESVVADGTIDYNRRRLAHLSTRAPGHVWRVDKQVGDRVFRGNVLGLVDAAEVGRAKADFLQLVRQLELRSRVLERQQQSPSAVSERVLRESEAAVSETRIRLFNAQQALVNLGLAISADEVSGLSDKQLAHRLHFLGVESVTKGLDPLTTTANLVPLLAPFEGVVVRCDMVEGEVVGTAQTQFVVADVRRLWVNLSVRQEDIRRVHKEQQIRFRPDDSSGITATGTVSWISPEVDDKTRTVPVRAEVQNPKHELRVRSFGTGEIVVAERPDAVTVPEESLQSPEESLQSAGSYYLVFVRRPDRRSFEPRTVRVGIRSGGYAEVLHGVRPGEVVAAAGSHVLRSELFRSEIGGAD
jgi:cobalt-zinc-cadmium efflux system membrane fusion protein